MGSEAGDEEQRPEQAVGELRRKPKPTKSSSTVAAVDDDDDIPKY